MCQVCLSCNPGRNDHQESQWEVKQRRGASHFFGITTSLLHSVDGTFQWTPPPHFSLPSLSSQLVSPQFENVKIKLNSVLPSPTLLPNTPFWTFLLHNTVSDTATGSAPFRPGAGIAPFPPQNAALRVTVTLFSELLLSPRMLLKCGKFHSGNGH